MPTRVNALDFLLLVDSGAAYTGLTRRAVETLGLKPRLQPGKRITPAHGRAVTLPTVMVNSLVVGGHDVQGLEVLVLDLPLELRIDGLLGMDFLSCAWALQEGTGFFR